MNSPKLLMFSLLLFSVNCLSAEDEKNIVSIKNGFIDGNDFRQFSEIQKDKYLMGIIDGINLSPFFGATNETLSWFTDCVVGMSNFQISAIIENFMNDHPERWHDDMHVLAYSSLRLACQK